MLFSVARRTNTMVNFLLFLHKTTRLRWNSCLVHLKMPRHEIRQWEKITWSSYFMGMCEWIMLYFRRRNNENGRKKLLLWIAHGLHSMLRHWKQSRKTFKQTSGQFISLRLIHPHRISSNSDCNCNWVLSLCVCACVCICIGCIFKRWK